MAIKKMFHRLPVIISILGIVVSLLYMFSGYLALKVRNMHSFVKDSGSTKHVLFISSYTDTFESTIDQMQGINEVFGERNISLNEDFMDTKTYNSREHILNFYNFLRFKVKNHTKYDGILIGDDAALQFFEEFGSELFPETPTIFFGIDDPTLANRLAENPYITGSVELVYLYDTLKEALRLFPKTTKIVSVYDNTPTGIGNQKQLADVINEFPQCTFENINASLLSKDELQAAIENVDGDSIFLFLGFFEDGSGNKYTLSSCAEMIGNFAKVPIFTKQIMSVGNGPFAGKIIDYVEIGRVAAKQMCDVLDGKINISEIPVYKPLKADFYFDYLQLHRFGLHRWQLPRGAIFVNKEPTYWDSYGKLFTPAAMIFVFLAILLAEVYSSYREARFTAKTLERSQRELVYSAGHDYLTGLPNRMLAKSEIESLIAQHTPFALMMLDVDDFKSINDFFGHLCGDEVLREIGRRLSALQADGDFFACRSGGDEFLLVYKDGEIEDGDAKMYYIREILNTPLLHDGKRIFIRVCIGLINYDGREKTTPTELASKADVALYKAKESGKNKFVLFNDEMRDTISREKKIALQLEEACENDGFSVVYQPQIDATTGEVQGYEALVRLTKTQLPPQVFIPIAEAKGLMVQIGRIVTKKVIEQMAQWKKEGKTLHKVAINYSSGQISDTSYVNYLKELLDTYAISTSLITIEVTESLFMSNLHYAKEFFKQLADIGVSLTLDDFGTGYSSLSYLAHLPIDTVKIDKSWIDSYLQEGKDTFIKNIVRLVHSLNMKLTVEGVEEKWQYDKLKEFECDSVQGYYFSKPLIASGI